MNGAALPLQNILVVNTGLNLPGPMAAKLLAAMGADVIKVEPPSGDTFHGFCRQWYEDMLQGVDKRVIDLRTQAGQHEMHGLLERAHILITSQRPAALIRMGLAPADLRQRWPELSIVNIVGSPAAEAHMAGHDLTYQAKCGLVAPPQMPLSLFADLAGAMQAALAALALLAAGGGMQEIALSEAAAFFRPPLLYGLTRPGGFLGGGHAGYALYATQDGWISLAALEPQFWGRVCARFPDLPADPLDARAHQQLSTAFAQAPTAQWLQWARTEDIPLESVVR